MERFIAQRLYGKGKDMGGGSRPASIIATTGIALGILVMIVTIAVTRGFKGEIREKVLGFTSHIQVQGSFSGQLASEESVCFPDSVLESVRALDCVSKVQTFVNKPCIVRTAQAFQGFVLKGIGDGYDTRFISDHIITGSIPVEESDTIGPWILLSRETASQLGLAQGDKADVHFMQDRIRMRRVTVAGIFDTGFASYDRMTAICGIGMLQKLNSWEADEYSGLEIGLKKGFDADESLQQVRLVLNRWQDQSGQSCLARTMEQMNAGLFAWLDVLDMNVWIILALMLGIAGFTMVSGLLIIIFERASTIGVLKSMGAGNRQVRRIFLKLASYIIVKGMVIGNVIGITLCLLQSLTHIIPLDPANYYIDHVPMQLGLGWLIILNAVMLAVSMLMMLIPTAVISRIEPARVVRWE